MTTTVQPAAKRLESLDFVRGCAVFGILLMNVAGMGLGNHAWDDPTVDGGATGINLWTWLVVNISFEGTQRGLFSLLFGAGVILLTSRLEAAGKADTADIFFRRNLWLIGFGLVNAWVLLWPGDILYWYGITAFFLYAFRKLTGRTLLAIGGAVLLLGALWSLSEARDMIGKHRQAVAAEKVVAAARSDEQKAAIEEWKEYSAKPTASELAEERHVRTASYASAHAELAPRIRKMESTFFYRYFGDVFGMMMIGMALFRLGILTLEAKTRTYLAMMAGGYAIGVTGNVLEAKWMMDHGFSALSYAQAAVSYDLSRVAMTIGHLGLIMLFLRSGILPWLRRSMAAVGRMALTNYLSHSLAALIFFVLLGYFGTLQRHQLYYFVGAVWLFQLVASPIWLRHFHYGPVEWLWRSLTYGKAQPFRKDVPPSVQPEPLAV